MRFNGTASRAFLLACLTVLEWTVRLEDLWLFRRRAIVLITLRAGMIINLRDAE
jgi:hypothetical protein